MTSPGARTARSVQYAATKVPEVGAIFWLIKVLTTGMGESASDYLAKTNLVLAGLLGTVGLVVSLWLQLRRRTHHAATYWTAVAMVAVFGTMAADGLHVGLGVPYAVSTPFFLASVVVLFLVWHRVEGTLSIHTITTRRREIFYWLTVLATFALGTAAGDLTAYTMHLGYLASAVVFAVMIAVPLVAWRLGFNAIAAFWTAYVLTRPLGASVADWLGKPPALGNGLGLGDGPVTIAAALLIAGLVGLSARQPAPVRARAVEPSPVLETE